MCWSIDGGEKWETPPGPYMHITAEGSETCAVTDGGEIVCWSRNGEPSSPVAWPPGHYRAVSLSDAYSCVLSDAGEAVCVGSAAWPEPPPGPFVAIAKASRFYALGTEYLDICALTEAGEGVCWGAYNEDQFAGSVGGSYTAIVTRINGFCGLTTEGEWTCTSGEHEPSVRYAAISTGGLHACAITEAGKAVCEAASPEWWLGDELVMRPPDPAPARYTAISAGGRFPGTSADRTAYACALTVAGRAVCWGNAENKVERPDPPPGGYVAVSDGEGHTCALSAAGEAVCWGWNNYGQAEVPPGRYTAISAGALKTCAITVAGEVACWGGYTGSIAIAPSAVRYVAVSTGYDQVCALTEDGDAVCWDGSSFTVEGLSPVETHRGPFVSISVGWDGHACALTDEGRGVCWGWNSDGQTDVPPGRYLAIDAGKDSNTCAITEHGEGICWGLGTSPPARKYTAIEAGSRYRWYGCAVTDEGRAVCWGPAAMNGPASRLYTAVSFGGRACALSEDNEVVCWGDTGYALAPAFIPE